MYINKMYNIYFTSPTQATKFKPMPAEPPNDCDFEQAIERISNSDPKLKELNLNNIRVSEMLLIQNFGNLY